MTWKPTEQPACPCKTCTGDPVAVPAYTPVQVVPEPTRTCGPEDPCGYCDVGDWIERTDPSPVAEPEPIESRVERLPKGVNYGPLPPAPEECYPPDAVDLPVEYARPSFIDRIRNATNRKA